MIGILQGRIEKKINQPLQSFPKKNWKLEFFNAKKIGFNYLEILDDLVNDDINPIFSTEGLESIKFLNSNVILIKSLLLHSIINYNFISKEDFKSFLYNRICLALDIARELGTESVILTFL